MTREQEIENAFLLELLSAFRFAFVRPAQPEAAAQEGPKLPHFDEVSNFGRAQPKPAKLTKLTQTLIDDQVALTEFHHFPGTTMTVCCLTLKNGFYVTCESACVDPAEFDALLGRRLAREDAVNKIWNLEAYMLRDYITNPKEAAQ